MVDQISKPPLLYVWGAPTIDWLNILDYSSHEGLSYWPLSRPQAEVHLTAQPGGSALLHLLLKKMIPSDAFTGDKKAEIKGTQFDNQAIETFEAIKRNGGKLEGPFHPFNSQARHNWTMWQKVSTDGSTTGDKQPRYTMVGWNDREIGAPECNDVMPCMEELSSDCSILFLLDDPDWGQEEDEEKYKGVQEALKNALQVVQNGESVQWAGFNYPPGIILKVSSYNNPSGTITQSAIYQMLLNSPALAQKTTLLTTVRDLRAEGARIGHSLSWERMLDDVVQAVDDCFKQRFGRVIVNVGLCGAVIVEEDSEARMRALIFTRSEQEDDEPQDVLGQSTCMMAALATAWAEYGDKMDWAKATCNGLRMIRSLHDTGYSVSYKSKNRRVLEFPIEDLCNQYYNYPPPMQVDLPNSSFPNADVEGDTEEIGTFITDAVQMQSTRGHTWTILHSELRKKRPAGDARDAARGARQEEQRIFYDIAMNVAKKGPKKALKNVPIEIVGQ
jgi:hypothetical protein